jgi:hypothetical protein
MKQHTAPAPTPRGEQPPQPDLFPWLLRGTLALCLALSVGHEELPRLAGFFAPAGELHSPLPALPGPDRIAVLAIDTARHPTVVSFARLISLAGLTVLGIELLLAAAWRIYQRRHAAARTTYVRVAAPAAAPGSRAAAYTAGGVELFQALHAAIGAGWCTLLIGGAPDCSATFGLRTRDDGRALAAIRALLRGIAPEARVDVAADPLDAAAPGQLLLRREFRLALPPHYPLRAAEEDCAQLGMILAALRPPPGVAYVEIQIQLCPIAPDQWRLDRGWRGRATALRIALTRRADYALADDIAAIETKLAGAPFHTVVRALALAEPAAEPAAAALLDALAAALAANARRTAGHVQRLVACSAGHEALRRDRLHVQLTNARAPLPLPAPRLLLPRDLWRPPDILAAPELATLWQLPAPEMAPLTEPLRARMLPAPPHAFANTGRIIVGHALRENGSAAPVGPTLDDLRQILHLTAGMGAGKSRLLANLCRQCIPHGFTLIDGKGDDREGSLVATVRSLIPVEEEYRVVILDPLDAAWPIGLNPLAGIDRRRPGSTDMALGQVLAIFARLDPETWGRAAGMQQFAQMATLLVIEGELQPTLAHIKRALIDETYRAQLLTKCSNRDVIDFWRITFPRLGEAQRTSRDALLRRLDLLLTAETTRLLASRPSPSLDLLDAIETGLIVLAPLPDMTLGDLSGAIGMLIFQAFVRAAFARSGADRGRTNYPLIVDELQVLIGGGDTRDVATAITRLRSLGIPTIYAHQALAQLGELSDLMLINAANRIILQTQEPDASAYARLYAASGLTAADISSQNPIEHQYAVLRCAGVSAGPFSLQPLGWPQPAADAAPEEGADWRAIVPQPSDPIDSYLLQIAYGEYEEARVVDTLAQLDAPSWGRLIERWSAIQRCQRDYILAHPGCIPDRMERQRWLSRLLVAQPRALAAAEYARAGRLYDSARLAATTA